MSRPAILIALALALAVTIATGSALAAPADSSAGGPGREEALRRYLQGRSLEQAGDIDEALSEYYRALALDPGSRALLVRISEAAARKGERVRSLEFAERALVLAPADARANWLKGTALFQMERAADALGPLEAACAADSENAEYARTLARVAEVLERRDLVLRSYSRVVWLDPDDSESWFQLAAAQARSGDFGAADSSLAESLDLNPIRPGALFLKGWIRESLGFTDEAIELYQQHLLVHTKDLTTRRRLVELLAQDKQYAKAHALAQQVVVARPQDPDALQMLADLAFALGRASEGERVLSQLRALDADEPEFVARSVQVMSRHGKGRDGARLAEAWAAARPGDVRGMMLAARALATSGQLDSAAARARRAVAAAPDSSEPRRLLVQVLRQGKHFPQAEQQIAELLRRRPADVALLLELGMVREEMGDVEGAIAAGRDALRLQPELPPVLNFLGYMLADHDRDLDDAESMLERAVQRDPENGAYLDSLGWLYYRKGRHADARRLLERALAETGGDPVIHEHLGDVYSALHLPGLAREQYRLSLASDESNPRVKRKMQGLH
ncbi:MAG: tetratricopeptide repeat protein [Candidatus Eisenbacteria bacterium]